MSSKKEHSSPRPSAEKQHPPNRRRRSPHFQNVGIGKRPSRQTSPLGTATSPTSEVRPVTLPACLQSTSTSHQSHPTMPERAWSPSQSEPSFHANRRRGGPKATTPQQSKPHPLWAFRISLGSIHQDHGGLTGPNHQSFWPAAKQSPKVRPPGQR